MNVVEPLAESCDWLSTVAELSCAADAELAWSLDRSAAIQDTSCAWYHGNWQYLRLLDLVSNPANHSAFYSSALQQVAGHLAAPNVLVCGAVSARGEVSTDFAVSLLDQGFVPVYSPLLGPDQPWFMAPATATHNAGLDPAFAESIRLRRR